MIKRLALWILPVVMMALLLLLSMMSTALPVIESGPNPRAKALLIQSMDAVGGIELLRGVETLSYHSVRHTFFHRVEVSESLPQIIVYEDNEVVLQPKSGNLHEKSDWRWTEGPAQKSSQLTITREGGFSEADDKLASITADGFYKALDILAANPIAALLSASEASDISLEVATDESEIVSFHQTIYGQQIKTTLGIHKQTHLLQWIENEHSYSQDVFSSFWGRTVRRVVLSGWSLDTSGLYFPTKWQVATNGRIDGQESLFDVKINADARSADFTLPRDFGNSFDSLHMSEVDLAKRNHADGKHLDVHDGIVMLPGTLGTYNSIIVKHDKGIIVIEAPYSNANSDYVISYAKKTFPGTSITGVVSTNQLQFHLGGLPAYARAHAPIYLLDSNLALMKRFLAAQVSDGQLHKSDIRLKTVAARTEIGSGENRITLIPFRGTASARMMAVYFPHRKLLYCSDMYLPQQWGGQYFTEHLSEVRDLIDREHIEVLQIAGVSTVPRDWKELAALIPGTKSVRKT